MWRSSRDYPLCSSLTLSPLYSSQVILQYATVEFELGRYDRGREVLEDLLMRYNCCDSVVTDSLFSLVFFSYPKRTDIWNVFVDKEIKYGNYDAARSLFSRMISLKVSSKNIKAIFKKYLSFEMSHGTEKEQEVVKQKARDYVSSLQ
jgi:rRNA biogenesis protein RRP5